MCALSSAEARKHASSEVGASRSLLLPVKVPEPGRWTRSTFRFCLGIITTIGTAAAFAWLTNLARALATPPLVDRWLFSAWLLLLLATVIYHQRRGRVP